METVRVGIRELKQNASAVVARVSAGYRVEITSHGKLAAIMLPPTEGPDILEQLIAAGKVLPASRTGPIPPPLPPIPGRPTASEALAELRADER
ncbi:MAG: type II toxin-antitoxin system Phd/YefM family antitoxin [Candidatus Dormibacteraceae bacterium]